MSAARQFSYYGASRALLAGGQLLLVPLAVGQLGASGYGVYNLMLQGAILLRHVALQGIAQVLVRDHKRLSDAHGEEHLHAAGLALMTAALLLIALPLTYFARDIAALLNVTSSQVWLLLAMALAYSLFGLKQVLLYNRSFSAYTVWDTLQGLVAIAAPVLVGLLLPTPDAYGVTYALATLILAIAIVGHRSPSIPSRQAMRQLGVTLRTYGLPLMLGEGMAWIVSVADRFQIASLLGVEQTGLYAAAYQLFVAPMTMLAFAVALVLQRVTFADGGHAYRARMERAATLLTSLSCGALVLAILLGKPVFAIFFRHQGQISELMIVLLVLTGAASGFFQLELIAGKYARNARTILLGQASGAVGLLIANWLLLPRIGIVAAAGTSLAAYLLQILVIRCSHSEESRFSYFNPSALRWGLTRLALIGTRSARK